MDDDQRNKSFKTDATATASSQRGTSIAATLGGSFGPLRQNSLMGSMGSISPQSSGLFGSLAPPDADGEPKRKKTNSLVMAGAPPAPKPVVNDKKKLPAESLEVREIEEEYNRMEEIMTSRGLVFQSDPAATTEENKRKNRYGDVLPNSHTSVKIGNPCGKYINANHVTDRHGNKPLQKYICCQAPLPDTFVDFWAMIWEKNCPVVVMLTRLAEQSKTKAHIYWPDVEGTTGIYGTLMVTLKKVKVHKKNSVKPGLMKKLSSASIFGPKKKEQEKPVDPMGSTIFRTPMNYTASFASFNNLNGFGGFGGLGGGRFNLRDAAGGSLSGMGSMANFNSLRNPEPAPTETQGAVIIRKFMLFDTQDPSRTTRELTQLHYTEWPDRGVPETTEQMSNLIRELDIRKKGLDEPIVVHCSAGIGRTGAFLAIHMSLQQVALDIDPSIDVFETVVNLRSQRHGMVQSRDQYKFVYVTIKDMLMDKYNKYNASSRSKRSSILNTSQTHVEHSVRSAIKSTPKYRPRRSASEPIFEDWKRIVEEEELLEKMKL